MRASPMSLAVRVSCQHSHRSTRRTPSRSTACQPVPSHRAHAMVKTTGYHCPALLRRADGRWRRVLDEIRGARRHERGVQPLLPIAEAARELVLDVLHELVDFALHALHLAPHVEHDLDPREIHAEIAREREDRLERLEVLI